MNSDRKPAALTLVNGPDSITIRPRAPTAVNPVICKAWDLGSPEYRYTTVANPGADGTTYSDGFVGARTVTFELAIMGDPRPTDGRLTHDAYWYANKLTAMTHPMARPVLEIVRDDETNQGQRYTMSLRGAPYNLPYTARSAALLEMQLVFNCPLGMLESEIRTVETAVAAGTNLIDWVFPAKFDKTFGYLNQSFPSAFFTVGGDTAVTPIIYIHGPCTNPQILGDGGKTNDRFAFDGLTLAAGETVQIDMGTGTVRLGTAATGTILDDMTVYNTVDWAVSTFWRWLPGEHTVSYLATTGYTTIQFYERRLTI